MDATFRITPRGMFQQVLVIYIKFGSKMFDSTYEWNEWKVTLSYESRSRRILWFRFQ